MKMNLFTEICHEMKKFPPKEILTTGDCYIFFTQFHGMRRIPIIQNVHSSSKIVFLEQEIKSEREQQSLT